ncbi:MAG: AAA family ATPase [Verrucomicrobiae bacterium]|nr:AAA family ATPase [Verrucomicrobiae bacterium]
MSSKERQGGQPPPERGGFEGQGQGDSGPWEQDQGDLTPLEIIDKLLVSIANSAIRSDLLRLRRQVESEELTIQEARAAIEKMDEVIKKVTSPANRVGLFLSPLKENTALIFVNGSEYHTNIDPRLNLASLKVGTRVLLNEAYVVIGDLGYDSQGPVGKVVSVLPDNRIKMAHEAYNQAFVAFRCSDLIDKPLKEGDELRMDPSFRVALEVMTPAEHRGFFVDAVEEVPWEKVGGQKEALQAIRDAVEMPLLHSELFEKYEYAHPKGFLLHGPPGCGKTLIGKACAYNLTRKLQEKTGHAMQQFFLHVKGPEILNMWVGESERIVREIFQTAREKRQEGFLPFIFIDEAESILGTRHGGRYTTIVNTLVPMFCAEMDGLDSLRQAVIILASNRADLIDPAILRPGRIDRKIKVARPDLKGAKEIFHIYLTQALPYAGSGKMKVSTFVDKLIDTVVEDLFAQTKENGFLEVTLQSGRKDVLTRGDLISGAIIESIVSRAKELAIKRAIAHQPPEGISEKDLLQASKEEFEQNEIFPPSNITEDWLKLIDYDPENVVEVKPLRTSHKSTNASGVI